MSNKFSRFLNGKGFYVALGICMIAIGVSAWSAIDKASAPPEDILSSDTAENVVSDDISSEAEVNKEQEGVEDDRDESSDYTESEPDHSEQKETADEANTNLTSQKQESTPTADYFVYPAPGEVIKKFSASELQYSVTFNDMRLHKGVDIKLDAGSEIKSAGDGKVIEIKNDNDLGYTVKIDHGNGMVALYAGLEKDILVKKDDVVTAGTKLGKLGMVNNECLDAPHLHLEFFEDGKAVNPLDYLN